MHEPDTDESDIDDVLVETNDPAEVQHNVANDAAVDDMSVVDADDKPDDQSAANNVDKASLVLKKIKKTRRHKDANKPEQKVTSKPKKKTYKPKAKPSNQNQQKIQAKSLWQSIGAKYSTPNSDKHFLEYVGMKRKAMNCSTPIEFFELFMTNDIINDIVPETNQYHRQLTAKKPSSMKWIDTTPQEMEAFFAMMIAMGVANLPELDDYWAKDQIFYMPWFSSVMTRNRFKQLLRYLHLNDNTKELPKDSPGHNKLFKPGKLPKTLNSSFSEMYAKLENK